MAQSGQAVAPKPKTKILFVCTGNTCRSPLAEIIFKNLCRRKRRTGIIVRSAGTAATVGADLTPEALIALQEIGEKIPTRPHRARQFQERMQQEYDVILSLENYPDPYGQGQAVYTALAAQLQTDLKQLYTQLFET